MIGSGERSRTKRSPSMSWAETGCSTNSRSKRLSLSIARTACLGLQAVLASTRICLAGAPSRMIERTSSSRLLPTLILRIGYSAASRSLSPISSGRAMPMVKLLSGARFGSRPSSEYTGRPVRLPMRSYSAAMIAARAAAFPRSAACVAASISWSANGPAADSRIGR